MQKLLYLVCLILVTQIALATELTDWTNAKMNDPTGDSPGYTCFDMDAYYFAYDCVYLYFKWDITKEIPTSGLDSVFYITVDADSNTETGSNKAGAGAYMYAHLGKEYIIEVVIAPVRGKYETYLHVWDPWNTKDELIHAEIIDSGWGSNYQWYLLEEEPLLEGNSVQLRIPYSLVDLESAFRLKYYIDILSPSICMFSDSSVQTQFTLTESINCADGKDNDCDGLVDCQDPECAQHVSCVAPASCGNGIQDPGETTQNCCIDVGCPEGYFCQANACVELVGRGGDNIILYVGIFVVIVVVLVLFAYFSGSLSGISGKKVRRIRRHRRKR